MQTKKFELSSEESRSLGWAEIVGFIGSIMLAASASCVAQNTLSADVKKSSADIARLAAEISQRIKDENKLPFTTYITPSTREVAYAMYYKNVQKRIENIGTEYFPKKNGEKLYGELIVYIEAYRRIKLGFTDETEMLDDELALAIAGILPSDNLR